MTIRDNSIDRNENNYFHFYHGNRLVIVGFSALGLVFDGYLADIFIGISIILWLWLPEVERLEKKIISGNKYIFLTVLVRILCFYLLLGFLLINHLNLEWTSIFMIQSLPEFVTWVFYGVAFMVILMMIIIIRWLVTNNPVSNIGRVEQDE